MRVLCSTLTLAALILSAGGVAFRPADPAHAGEIDPSALGFTPIEGFSEIDEVPAAPAVTEESTRRQPPIGVCAPNAPAKASEPIALDPRRLHARAREVVPLSGRGYNYRPPSPLFPSSPLFPASKASPSPRASQKPSSP